jgi:adenylyltransferase/sulfurtransferase
LLLIDALSMQFRAMTLRKDPACPACGTRTITELIDYDEFCGAPGNDAAHDADDVLEITPCELAERLESADDTFDLIDVREPGEWAIARIDGARLIPLGRIPASLGSLDKTREIVVMCRSGVRSGDAARFMQREGFVRVRNLAGGILRWSADVDPRVPRY